MIKQVSKAVEYETPVNKDGLNKAMQMPLDINIVKHLLGHKKLQKAVMEFVVIEDNIKKVCSSEAEVEVDLTKYPGINPYQYLVYKRLGIERLTELGFDKTIIRTELINIHNEYAESKLRNLLLTEFEIDKVYMAEEIKSKLQKLYLQVDLRNKTGMLRVAKANEIRLKGRLIVKDWIVNREGKGQKEWLVIGRDVSAS